jgi:hypothetical protein
VKWLEEVLEARVTSKKNGGCVGGGGREGDWRCWRWLAGWSLLEVASWLLVA